METRKDIQTQDKHRISKILWFLYCIFLLASVAIIGKIVYLQYFWEPDSSTISEFLPNNYKSIVKPERGAITDRNGNVIVDNTEPEGERVISQEVAGAAIDVMKGVDHDGDGWLLQGVRRVWFEERAVSETEVMEERWTSELDAAALATAGNLWRPRYQSAAELRGGIDYRQRNGLDASEYEEHYWGRWFYPLNVLALCLAAIPFAFGSLRSGGLGRRLFIGVVFALGFWLLQNQFVRLAGVYRFDFRIAYLIPPLVMLAVSFLLFRRRSG